MLTVDEARAIVAGNEVDDEVYENPDYFRFGPKVHAKDLWPRGIVAPGDAGFLVDKRTGELISVGSAEWPDWSDRLGRMRKVRSD